MYASMIRTDSNSIRETFFRDGFIGPCRSNQPRADLDRVAARIDAMLAANAPNPLYGRFSVRDWHLLDEELLAIFTQPAIIEIVSAILGPDLLLWRSKIFVKRVGEGELGWHQEWGAFNGEEIGNDRPGLQPAADPHGEPWNVTVWVALDDVSPQMGPVRFARGTHRRRFPITMKPIIDSEFWHDPFLGISDAKEIILRARNNSLVLDIDTSGIFDEEELARIDLREAKARVLDALRTEVGAVTLDFDPDEHDIVDVPMECGSFVVFSERTMHGSSANLSTKRRLAVNARYTRSSTVVYPFRHDGQRIDGSNLDISRHECILVSGAELTGRNVVRGR